MGKRKCDQCGKSYKGLAAHKRLAHGAGISSDEDTYQPSFLRGELGEIADISVNEPKRALEMHAHYIKGQHPMGPRQVLQHRSPESGRWHNLHSRPITEDES